MFKKYISRPIVLSVISGVFILFFLVMSTLTYGPIIQVEANYQYHKFLFDTFHVTNLRALILPQFNFDLGSQTKYPQLGMVIPKLFLDEPIIANVNPNNKEEYLAALKKGIAHAAGTQLPGGSGSASQGGQGGGQDSIGYYFAHSSQPDFVAQYNAVFYLLGKLQPGDLIYLWRDGQKYTYTVTTIRETTPGDVAFVTQKYTTETIVLQTCWPPGTTQDRLLVFAQRKK